MIQNILATLAIILFITSPILVGCYLSKTRSRYRIKEIENTFIPQVRKKFTWYSIGKRTLLLFYENSRQEEEHCTLKTMEEAVKVLDRYKEAIREKEVKYHEYN